MVDGWCCRRAWGAGWVSGLPSSCLWLLVALSFCPVQLSFFFFFLPVRPHDVTTAAPWLATDIDGSAWAVHGCEANYEAQADRPLTSFFPFSLPLCSPSPSPSPSILLFSRPLLRDLSLCSSPSSTYPPATLPVPYTGPRSLPGLDHNHGPCAIHVHVPLVSLVLLFSRTIPLELPLLVSRWRWQWQWAADDSFPFPCESENPPLDRDATFFF
ncbi:hypothetical protein EDD21DRAFT_214968 [Dissophora ornata]|nr:hypothetical protein EDD21DRAFT_214968 [Dissophora ornata]